jgi:hypothetical protein
MSLLALSSFAVLQSCGGTSSASSVDKGTPSSDESSLFLVGAQALDAAECIGKADMSAKLIEHGVLDLAFASSYRAILLVGNQLPGSGSPMETERVSLSGAEITLMTADGALVKEYSTIGTGFIEAAAASAAYAAMPVVVIPTGLAQTQPIQQAHELVAKIRVLGKALNGTELTSSETDLPIKVCTGCLVQYPPSAADLTQPANAGYMCATDGTTSHAAAMPCVLGQDVPFSCDVCAGVIALCRDPTLNPSLSQ